MRPEPPYLIPPRLLGLGCLVAAGVTVVSTEAATDLLLRRYYFKHLHHLTGVFPVFSWFIRMSSFLDRPGMLLEFASSGAMPA